MPRKRHAKYLTWHASFSACHVKIDTFLVSENTYGGTIA